MIGGPYKANSAGDLLEISDLLKNLSGNQIPAVLYHVFENRLMLTPFPTNFFLWCMRFRSHTKHRRALFWFILNQKTPELTADLIKQLSDHMLSGKDTVDSDSAGGFCQAEIDILENILMFVKATLNYNYTT